MKKQGLEVPFPGVDNSQRGGGALTIRHTKYYQWVAFTLFFQVSECCVICYLIETFHSQLFTIGTIMSLVIFS